MKCIGEPPVRKIPFKALRCAIVNKGWYAKDLADAIHISAGELSKKLSGKRPWSMNEIYSVIDALGLSADQIATYWPIEDVRMCGY